MQLKNLFADEDAVSPVIGVILMVAITVILAAVIGAFVLGIGGSQDQPPQASWEWEAPGSDTTGNSNVYECSTSAGSGTWVEVTHQGGDEIETGNLKLGSVTCDDGNTINAGSAVAEQVSSGSVSLVWQSPSSDSTSILSTFEV